jgi:hypothetical protein
MHSVVNKNRKGALMLEDNYADTAFDNAISTPTQDIETNQNLNFDASHMKQILNKIDSDKLTNSEVWSEDYVSMLAAIILLFTLISLVLATIVLVKQRASQLYTLRTFAIINILGLATFTVIVGHSVEQINGVITLFSALIGYLLGKDASHVSEYSQNQNEEPRLIEKENSTP